MLCASASQASQQLDAAYESALLSLLVLGGENYKSMTEETMQSIGESIRQGQGAPVLRPN